MASAVVGALRVILSADTAEFDTAMKRVASSAKSWSTDLTSIGRQATAVGTALTRTLTLPLLGLGVASVKAAMDFESSFAGVRKTVEATEPEFAALAQGLRDMAKEIPVSVDELNKVAEAAGQLGIKKGDILAFTRTMADLGVTTNLTADEAATATAQIQNIFGAAGKDVDRFGATLVALGNAGASTEKDIIEMGKRIAGAGHQVGLTQAQVLSFASALSSVGINAEAGGSAISRVFLKINDAVAKGGADLREFARVSGMSAGEFKKAWQDDAATATTAFIAGLGKLKASGENVNATIEGLVGKNIILKDTLMRASGAGTLLAEQLALGNRAWQENSALTKEAAERYKTFASQLTVLWNQVRDVAITLGTALLPTMKDLLTATTPLVGLIAKMADMFAKLPEPVRVTAVAIAAVVAATGPAIWAFGQIATSAGIIIKQFTAKGLVMRIIKADYAALALSAKGLVASLGPLALAIAAVWAAWKIGNTETVRNSIAEWGLASENLTAKLYRAITGIEKMTPAEAKAAVAATAASEATQKHATAIDQTSAAAADFVGPMEASTEATNNFQLRQEEATETTKKLAAAAKAAHEQRLQQLKEASALETRIREENKQFAAEAIGAIDKQKAAQRDYFNWLGERRMENDAAAMVLPSLGKPGDAMAAFMSGFDMRPLEQFTQTLKDKLRGAWDGMKEGLTAALANIPQTLANAFTGGGDILGAIKSIVSQVGSTIGAGIGFMFGGPLGQKIGAAIGSMAGMLVNPLKRLFGIGINEVVRKANVDIFKLKAELISTHGGMEMLEARANAVGLSFKEAWGHQGQAGLAAFQELMKEFEKRWKDNEAALESLNAELETTQGEMDTLIGQGRDLGYEFDQFGNLVSVDFDKVKEKAEEFGVSVDGLGASFRQQGINAEAKRIVDGFELMAKAGGDVGGILVGMKDEIGKLVGESLKLGTTIPANMKPWIEELARTHQLVDANGKEITDLSQIKFGEPVKTEFEKISGALLEVISKIQELIDKIAAIPDQKKITITTDHQNTGTPPGEENHGYGGSELGFAVGTMGRFGSYFKNFGSGFATSLHGVEAVVTPEQRVPFAMDVLAGLNAPSSQAALAQQQPIELHNVIENRMVMDGNELKRWILESVTTAIENNERGIRSRQRDALGVT